jgi:hypothetical protein
MEKHDRLDALDRRPPAGRNLLLLGLWMRATIAGAAFVAAGFAALIDPPQGTPVLTALTLIVAGGTFAWLAWQRTTVLLDRIDAKESLRSHRDNALLLGPVARATGQV